MAMSKSLREQSDLYNSEGSVYVLDYVSGIFKVV